jgi:hypothetical protein
MGRQIRLGNLSAHLDVLLYLHDTEPVLAALGLDRQHKVSAAFVHSDVQLVSLELAALDCGPQMILQRVAGYPGEDID